MEAKNLSIENIVITLLNKWYTLKIKFHIIKCGHPKKKVIIEISIFSLAYIFWFRRKKKRKNRKEAIPRPKLIISKKKFWK